MIWLSNDHDCTPIYCQVLCSLLQIAFDIWVRFFVTSETCAWKFVFTIFCIPMWRELSRIPNLWETKNGENTCQRKTITRTRQYLCGSAICLRPRSCKDITIIREEYKVQPRRLQYFLSIYNTTTTPTLKNLNYKMWFHNGLTGSNRPQ